jgi:TolB-like protein
MKKLVTELKRRNVMRVAIAYAIAGWVLMQIAATVLPIFEAPPWTLKVVTFLIVLGFPIALILAWAFELTPEGIKREADVERSDSITTQTGRKLDRAIIVVLLAAITWLAADKLLWTDGETRITEDKRSVAVIPFQNMSQDTANEPFTIGIHDDLLTQISRIGSIKTISRTSVLQYRDTTKTIPEIAQELGVATILEGGVQRAGARVRINAQLIDAATDEHLWAETYDRELNAINIFAIQSEIALAIAEALHATLTEDEHQRIANVPTRSIAALESYFVGKQLIEQRNIDSLLAAVEYFKEVIKLDPDFALAHSGLADAYMLLPEYTESIDLLEVQEKSQAAAAKAISLDPDLPEVLTSMGWNRLNRDYDWAGAEKMLRRALEIQANNSGALHWLSHVLSLQGNHDQALTFARKAVVVDPLSSLMKVNLSAILADAGQIDNARTLAQSIIESAPIFTAQMRNLWLHEMSAGNSINAANALEAWAAADGRDVAAAREMGTLFVQHQQSGELVEISDELVTRLEIGSAYLAQVYAFVGDSENTLQALETAFEERMGSRSVLSMKINPVYDFIRDEPRFVTLLEKVGLSE